MQGSGGAEQRGECPGGGRCGRRSHLQHTDRWEETQTHKVVVEEKKYIRRFGKTRTRQAAGAAHLEENLVAVQVLGLPAGGADGATGVWQQRDQLADFIHVELQHGGAAGLHWDPCRELLQGQLQTHTWLCSSSDNQESTQ